MEGLLADREKKDSRLKQEQTHQRKRSRAVHPHEWVNNNNLAEKERDGGREGNGYQSEQMHFGGKLH